MEKYMPFIWIGFAIVMAVCEAATTQLVSVWFVLGAVCAAISTIFTPSIFIQLIVFLVVSAVSLAITRPLIKKFKKSAKAVSTNADRVIGKTGVVIVPIDDMLSVGQVKVLGETWSAISDNAPLKKDTKIKVLSIEGVKLVVEPIE